ncbi:MAG: VCBS repeat-containing protein [Sphingobacteriales bacterium]|nr:MAG: VCBS repeat-containing protein [Sphingobacteriales bacterium]
MKSFQFSPLAGFLCIVLSWFCTVEVEGQITFGPEQVIAQSEINLPILVGTPDFNGDGFSDILMLSEINRRLSWFQNLGSNNFGPLQYIDDLSGMASEVRYEDFDSDGDQDILVALGSGWIWFANDGTGNFNPPQPAAGVPPFEGVLGDLNGDGIPDLVTAGVNETNFAIVSWKPGDGLGNYGAQEVLYTSPFLFSAIGDFKLADISNDGYTDVIISVSAWAWGGSFGALLNDGSANFTWQGLPYTIACGMTFAIADFNNDGLVDIAKALQNNDVLEWEEQTSPFNFTNHNLINPIITNPTDVYVADVDEDGLPDVISASGGNGNIVWHKNQPGTTFAPSQIIIQNTDNNYCDEFAYMNNLNKITYFGYETGSAEGQLFYQHQAWMNFLPDALNNPADNLLLSQCVKGAAADLNNDGFMDFVALTDSDDLKWFLNDGAGNFTFVGSYASIKNFVLADVNNDGFADFLNRTFGGGSSLTQIYLNDGFAGFAYAEQYPISPVEVGDINNDGNIDIIGHLGTSPNWLVWLEGDGAGSFGNSNFIAGAVCCKIKASDLDGDGDDDIIVVDETTIYYYENLGNGSDFTSAQIAAYVNGWVEAVCLADMDGDGDLDIVAATSIFDKIVWFENLSNNPQIMGTVFYDFNQNGLLDEDDFGLNFQNIAITPNSINTYTNANGTFAFFYPEEGDYILTFTLPEGWMATSPTTLTVNVTSTQGSNDNNFGIYPVNPVSEIQPYLISGFNRCNDIVTYYLTIANEGTAVEDLTIVAFQPDDLLTFISANPPPDSVGIMGTVYWHINNLLPNSNNLIIAGIQAPGFSEFGTVLQNNLNVTSYDSSGNQTFTNSFAY